MYKTMRFGKHEIETPSNCRLTDPELAKRQGAAVLSDLFIESLGYVSRH